MRAISPARDRLWLGTLFSHHDRYAKCASEGRSLPLNGPTRIVHMKRAARLVFQACDLACGQRSCSLLAAQEAFRSMPGPVDTLAPVVAVQRVQAASAPAEEFWRNAEQATGSARVAGAHVGRQTNQCNNSSASCSEAIGEFFFGPAQLPTDEDALIHGIPEGLRQLLFEIVYRRVVAALNQHRLA